MNQVEPDKVPFIRTLDRLRQVFWRRRFIHWLIRAVWLTLLVPVALMIGHYWQSWAVNAQMLLIGMLVVGALVVVWAIRPISLGRMTHRLDQRLELRTRLTTALEVGARQPSPENPVTERLLQEVVHLVVKLRSQVRLLDRAFWLEMRTLVGVAALLSALLVLNNLQPRLPDTEPAGLPPAWQEPAADDVLQPDPRLAPPSDQSQMQSQAISDDQLQAALKALADALRDQASSRSISEAIDRGDLSGAAEETRRLADRLDQLSSQAQQQLGDSMQEAADNIGESVPEFTEPLQSGSNALNSGDTLGGSQSLDQLAEALDSISENESQMAEGGEGGEQSEAPQAPSGQGQEQAQTPQEQTDADQQENAGGEGAGGGEGGEETEENPPEQPTEEERLAAEGQPLELESDFELEDRTLQAAELEAEAGDKLTQDSPFARQPLNSPGDLGPDPLNYPWEKREVIRSYFTPE